MKLSRLATVSALVLTFPLLSACGQMPWYRQMQAEAKSQARITELTAEGKAKLAEAQSTRQVVALNAKMRLEAARSDAQREVIRAEGVAKANAIIADSLGGPEGYLRWKYIEMLEENKKASIIYIPTEAGLPILEAGKR